jgi:hypothetical protein
MTTPTISTPHAVVPIPDEKFGLLFDGGVHEVPDDYVHSTWLGTFFKAQRPNFRVFDSTIKHTNFAQPSRIMLPGERFHIRALAPVCIKMTSSNERLEFLMRQGAVFTGVQGLALAFVLIGAQLPKGKHYSALDHVGRLYQNAHLQVQVPDLNIRNDGALFFECNDFAAGWYGGNAMICFNEVP